MKRVKLRDHMHFSVVSTEAVVEMYFDAIQQMISSAGDGAHAARQTPRVLADAADAAPMATEVGSDVDLDAADSADEGGGVRCALGS